MTITETITRTPRVLIVDDTDDARALLRIKLGVNGLYQVVGEAADGLEAVRQARVLQPELIILDMAMPGMDGLEALPLLRDAAPGARVIVLTVFQPGALEDQAMAAGADRYVVKGGRMRDLMNVIDDVLHV
ncbi:DNA-binding NarL/FixJ family response regulator [Marmoricola sp. OAE513]|uniref:response regulator transcription factor n=1 Tax=Marmoricola sp. OAE513 TaxID=2817894 RepID=UPI001AE63E8A